MELSYTNEDAARLLRVGKQTNLSHTRIEVTCWLMNACKEQGWEFTDWNEPLFPALDSFGDMEVLLAVEETFDVAIDDAETRAAQLETFGDFVHYLEPYLAPGLERAANERTKLASASCATQMAFYVVRRRLCAVGIPSRQVHRLSPRTRLLDLPSDKASTLAHKLGN